MEDVTASDPWIALGLLCAGFFMDAVDITIIQVTLPTHLGRRDPRILGVGAVSVVLLVGFVVHERRTRDPLIPLDIVRPKTVKVSNLVTAALNASAVTVLFFDTQYFQSVLGYDAFWTGLAFLPMGIPVLIVSTSLPGQLVSRYGLRLVLTIGLGSMLRASCICRSSRSMRTTGLGFPLGLQWRLSGSGLPTPA